MKRSLQVPLGFQSHNVTLVQADLLMAGYLPLKGTESPPAAGVTPGMAEAASIMRLSNGRDCSPVPVNVLSIMLGKCEVSE